jgi:hypothetical protein
MVGEEARKYGSSCSGYNCYVRGKRRYLLVHVHLENQQQALRELYHHVFSQISKLKTGRVML